MGLRRGLAGDTEVTMSNTERIELLRAVARLKRCTGALRARYGESVPMRRLINDVERLDIDAEDVARSVPLVPATDRSEVVVVPDTPYDPSLWRDADEEGVGGLKRP